ncbi:MAG: metal-dependent transcriptional regulator [Lachnospiraceae bacterium]|nr:metal-dependent transcriptional regulator [Lachnospiraceae bacterium]
MHKLQESGEMYLETILILSQQMSYVRSIDVVEYMGFSKPSVSRAVNLLKKESYIEIDRDGHITLTESGREIAERIYDSHKLLTKLLISLGVDPKTAQEDACKMEHDISDETFHAIKRHLNGQGITIE